MHACIEKIRTKSGKTHQHFYFSAITVAVTGTEADNKEGQTQTLSCNILASADGADITWYQGAAGLITHDGNIIGV